MDGLNHFFCQTTIYIYQENSHKMMANNVRQAFRNDECQYPWINVSILRWMSQCNKTIKECTIEECRNPTLVLINVIISKYFLCREINFFHFSKVKVLTWHKNTSFWPYLTMVDLVNHVDIVDNATRNFLNMQRNIINVSHLGHCRNVT